MPIGDMEMKQLGANLPPVAETVKQMGDEAKHWNENIAKGDGYKKNIMSHAYQLRLWWEEDENFALLVEGALSIAEIPNNKNSKPFTRLLNLAFLDADWRENRVRVHRWAGALEYAWNCEPKPTVETLFEIINANGGEVGCNER